MTSARKIAANRRNGRKSYGPKSIPGKARASRNALRHGLAAVRLLDPVRSAAMAQLADAICTPGVHPMVREQVAIIAQSEIILRAVRQERVFRIERVRDGQTIALAKPDNSFALAKARSEQTRLAIAELKRINAQYRITEDNFPVDELEARPAQPGWKPPPPVPERDEFAAMEEAMSDLMRLLRYERRAWSARKRAIHSLIRLQRMLAGASEPADQDSVLWQNEPK